MGTAYSDSVNYNRAQMLSILVLLLAYSQDWTCNLHMIVTSVQKFKQLRKREREREREREVDFDAPFYMLLWTRDLTAVEINKNKK